MEAGFALALAAPPRPGATARFLLIFGAIFLAYLGAIRIVPRAGVGAATPRLILGFALLFRLTFLGAAPVLSDDIYRYLWDGRIVLSGGNPYLETPAAAGPASPGDPLYARLAHKEVGTIYPPVAQLLFAAGAAMTRGPAGIKIILLLCDLAATALLLSLLKRLGLPASRALVYAWNPLTVIEVAWSGHLEPAGLLLTLLATFAIIQGWKGRSAVALTLAGLVKILPLALFLPFARSLRAPRVLVWAPLLAAAAFWPFRAAGRHLASGAGVYARHWSANEAIFGLVRAAIIALDPTPALKRGLDLLRSGMPGQDLLARLYPYLYPDDLARAFCAAVAAAGAIVIVRRVGDPLRGAYLLTGLLLLLSPTLHPWYLLWVLPWVSLYPSRAWVLLTGLSILFYVNLGAPSEASEPYPWIRFVEYLPFFALLAWDGGGSLLVRRRAGW